MHEMCVCVCACVHNYFQAGRSCLGLLFFDPEADLTLCPVVHASSPG